MNARGEACDSDRAVEEAAARWHDCLLDENVSEEVRARFAAWLEEKPAHRAEYARVQRTWSAAQRGRETLPILALRHETALRLTRRHAVPRRVSKWAVITSPLLLLGIALLVSLRMHAPKAPPAQQSASAVPIAAGHYVTGVGERLSILLEDGSHVMLNSRTAVEVEFESTQRRVSLLQGQAYFEVNKDPARPFVVVALKRRFIAVGTAFDLRVDEERTQITMLEGVVRAEPPRADGSQATMVKKGEQLTADSNYIQRITAVDPEAVTSWRRGQIFFDDARLADAIAEMNRYRTVPLVLADPSLGDLRISGAFSTASTSAFPEALAASFPIVIGQSEGAILLMRPHR